ncbi:hypothetical protein AGABI1DRAFT_123732 [Agaricus bisporus var. burnettii JB137-S8]|uniref:Nucleolar 27S pre-rRNA processing Urb2/Npa2 C-terminal domain-containing protein n=1 Tax=Agaricus bisporus var. burnettii (strain JB137-S8 / ATCC MYA-4627 / FGSC 10392) TaxID=597362 RepID=K5W959_AGABU|nr:uncharacterized protein AGABI1DRAFT_123732 [Agaricus bisporus var. burnettii JB137-S8]EKM83399.1 hypothetical protein AGABI1DRAFT_123732 [Agaricus bisporus var. burnettii JB137-S8]
MALEYSSREFIQTLKTTLDPGAPDKIEIARRAWDDSGFYLPNKAEVIVEWILSTLLKNKSQDSSTTPVFKQEYWKLLSDVLSDKKSVNARPLKTWLTPLLHRIPLQAIMASFLANYRRHEVGDVLADTVSTCINILWPISVQKMSLESLADLFGLLLGNTDDHHSTSSVLTIAFLVTSSYRTSLGNAVNKKKFYQLFLQSFLTDWIRVLSVYTTPRADLSPQEFRLYQNIYESGADTFFNLEILRQLSDSRPTDQSNALFSHLNKSRSSSGNFAVLSAIPPLFSSYVQAVKRYRGAVFSQHSNLANVTALNDETHAACMRFFANCEAVIVGDNASGGKVQEVGVWRARLKLLETTLDESLFNAQQEGATAMLITVIEDAIGIISCSWNGEHEDVISLAIKCLHKIGQIDCDLLLPSLSRILPSLLPVPAADSSVSDFLDLIINYHIKTRSINVHINNLLICLSPASFPIGSTDIRVVYELCFSGHVLSNRNLDRLGNAIQTFLTPGQTVKSVEGLLNALESSLQGFFGAVEGGAGREEGLKKKRRGVEAQDNALSVGTGVNMEPHDAESLGVSFSLRAYLALVIFSNLPLPALNESSGDQVQDIISQFQVSMVEGSVEKLFKLESLLPGGGKKKRRRDYLTSHEGWATQIVAAAISRIHYALSTAKSLNVGKRGCPSKITEQLRDVVTKEGGKGSLIAELELEIYRILLQDAEQDIEGVKIPKIIDNILSYLNGGFKPSDSTSWSGLPCDLKSQQSGALAVLHLILERWLPLIDRFASPSQITNIIQLLLDVEFKAISTTPSSRLRPKHLLLRLLHNAEFWEMQNFRSAFLSYLVETTGSDSREPGTESAAYRLLLYIPTEYLTKAARTYMIKRAYLTDLQLVRSLSKGKNSDHASVLEDLVTLRVFLKRVIGLVGFERNSDIDLGDFVAHLISFNLTTDGSEHKTFIESTLDLIELYFGELLKDPKAHSDALLKAIGSFGQYPAFVREGDSHSEFRSRAIATLLNVITTLKDGSSLSVECISSLRTFLDNLGRTTLGQLRNISRPQLAGYSDVLSGWCCVLKLRKWLNETRSEKDRDIGRHLVSLTLQEPDINHKLDDIRVSIFSTLQGELNLLLQPMDRQKQLELILAAYVAFKSTSTDSACVQLDEHISSTARGLPPDDYSYTLDYLLESLTPCSTSTERLETILHLSILLLRDHPQHTLKHVQSFATQTLNAFAGSQIFTNGTISLRLLTLEFILQHCSERPAALQQVDMGSIWTVLFHFLEPSGDHDEATTPEIFHKIVGSAGALVRLRRDLLTSVLPHLGLVLRRLLSVMRSCRPQLGIKQTAIVMRTQPRWITANVPLGSRESRMLSRLLEMLNVKTIVRNHTASEMQKSESLSKPFSKHAAYVLAAYIEALSEPLCVLSMEVRRELEPGLFSLCALMGEHARDALIVSLDASGKATLKLIWKEYEKQRYVGKVHDPGHQIALPSTMLSIRGQTRPVLKQSRTSRSWRCANLGKWRALATVSPSILHQREPPPPPPLSVLDGHLLSTLDTSRNHASLASIVHQYKMQSGDILNISLPYESRPPEQRRPSLTQAHSGLVLVAHCIKDGSENKISLSTGFALEAPSPVKDETLILTCTHTLEEVRRSPLYLPGSPAFIGSPGTSTGSFCITYDDRNGEDGGMAIHPISGVTSALPRSDLLLLSCKVDTSKCELKTLPVSPYPVPANTPVKAHFVALTEPKTEGWYPWIGDTWSKWITGTVSGYRDYAGREAEPGTYDSLSHIFFTPPPTPGSSGGPIIEEASGAVVGVILGSRMDNRIEGVKGWGVPSESIYEMFTLPGLEGKT